MAWVADGFVGDVAVGVGFVGFFERFDEGSDAARGVEGFVFNASEAEVFEAVEGWDFDHLAIEHNVAGLAVFVDDAFGAPGDVVLELVGGELREGAHAECERVDFVELSCDVVGGDCDVARGQATLRDEGDLGALALAIKSAHGVGGFDVFGDVKVMHTRGVCGFGDAQHHVVWEHADDAVLAFAAWALQRSLDLAHVGDVEAERVVGDVEGVFSHHLLDAFAEAIKAFGRFLERGIAAVGDCDVVGAVAAGEEEFGDGLADFAGAEDEDGVFLHLAF